MGLADKVKELMSETKEEVGNELQSRSISQTQQQEGKDMLSDKSLTDLSSLIIVLRESVENLNSSVYSFSVATNKVNEDKKEMEKLARDVAKLKLDVGTVLNELQRAMKVFPDVASQSIQSSIGVTSGKLEAAINGLVLDVRRAISSVFKEEVKFLKQAANDANKSAESMRIAKEFVGWQFFAANSIAVTAIALVITLFVSPSIKRHELDAEENKYITYGKTLEAAWPKLSEKAKQEIKAVSSAE